MIHSDIRNAATQINHRNAILLLVRRHHRVGHYGRTGEDFADLDAGIQKDAAQTVLGNVLAEDEVVGR